MAAERRNRYTIRIGGDASGVVVAGDDNRVEVHEPPGSIQTNTAHDHGTVYAVTDGDMHIHDAPPPEA
jgi:hypothetical protein